MMTDLAPLPDLAPGAVPVPGPAPAQAPAPVPSPSDARVDQLVQALDRAYNRPRLLMWRAFLQGLMTGVGAALGTLLVAASLTYLIHSAGGIKLIQPLIDKLQESIVNSQIQAANKLGAQIPTSY